MKAKRLHHIAVLCSNYERSKKFYTETLGLSVIKETYRSARQSYKLDLAMEDGTKIELFSFPDPPKRLTCPEACGLRHLAFLVSDLDRVVQDLKDQNIPVEPIRIDELTGKRFTFFSDPDDLPLELYEA